MRDKNQSLNRNIIAEVLRITKMDHTDPNFIRNLLQWETKSKKNTEKNSSPITRITIVYNFFL